MLDARSHAIDPAIMRIARTVARDLAGRGACAIALTGSHVRGDAHAHSDIDLIAIVRRYPNADENRGWLRSSRVVRGQLVTLSRHTPAIARADMRHPQFAPTYVPGWREAIILHDPDGIAVKLQREAVAWTWETIAKAADERVAEEIAGLAEEVHKLAGLLSVANAHGAAVQRSVIALQLAGLLALRHRILYSSENVLWDLVAERMGEPWASTQAAALSESGETLDASCRAALRLYALAAAEARPLLDRPQRAVVDAALGVVAAAMPALTPRQTP